MNSNLRNRLLMAAVLATTAPLALVSTQAVAQGQGHQQKEQTGKKTEAQAKEERQQAAQAREQARQQDAKARQQQVQAREHQRQAAVAENGAERQRHLQAAQDARQRQAVAEQRASARRAEANQVATKAARDQARADRQQAQIANQRARQDNRAERQQSQVANQAARQQDRSERQVARRLARADQERLITQQKARVSSYRNWTTAQRAESARIAAAIQAQNRAAQYAYINDYNTRWYAQQQRYATMGFDYYNDPYFYSAPSYRYMRDGAWYTINQYGANMLQTAINDGYGEGYRAGRADRMDGWRADYRSNWVYQNASYGYNGYYLDRGEYAYYFRQGFRRGYEDGYYSRYQYGSYHTGSYSILGAVVNTILGLQSYDNRY
jgi:hypothetical protein